jgi:hypothetical protein
MKNSIRLNFRLLFFRTSKEELETFSDDSLKWGIFCTWVVGMGRWWDDPNANIAQHLGLGSLAYVFILSLVIFLLVKPLNPQSWSYIHVLTFVSLTSMPALLYAIPVERFCSLETAAMLNVLFLTIVAVWRVALFLFYLFRHARLNWFYTFVVGFLPLTGIVSALFALNLERVVFNIMGGLRDADKSANDGAYGVLFVLTILSIYAIVPLLVFYFGIIIHARKKRKASTLEEKLSI